MDLLEIVSELPAQSHLRQVITYCTTELHLSMHETVALLKRAAEVAQGVRALDYEGQLASGELVRRNRDYLDGVMARWATTLDKLKDC